MRFQFTILLAGHIATRPFEVPIGIQAALPTRQHLSRGMIYKAIAYDHIAEGSKGAVLNPAPSKGTTKQIEQSRQFKTGENKVQFN